MSISQPNIALSDEIVSPERSALMARIRARDTRPEMLVRQLLHGLGYRYRLHRRSLPGSPDLVFPSRHKVIFVHGCFWHRHVGCRRTTTPKTRAAFWQTKFEANLARDARDSWLLKASGWKVLVVWECETKNKSQLCEKLTAFLGPVGSGKHPATVM